MRAGAGFVAPGDGSGEGAAVRAFAVGFSMLALAACGAGRDADVIAQQRPSELSAPERQTMALSLGGDLCPIHRQGRARTGVFDMADFRLLEQAMREQGLSDRDIALMRGRGERFGAGQSLAGLKCAIPGTEVVERRYDRFLGHIWYARTPSGRRIELRGEGRDETMRVHGWN